MEEYLTQLFEQDGVAIFSADYHLLLKLLDKYPNGPLRNDSYCIHGLLGGNALYKSIIEALKNEKHEVSRAEYNAFVAQMYNGDRFWNNMRFEPAHLENLLRMLYHVAGISIPELPLTVVSSESEVNERDELLDELRSAEAAYDNQKYRTAFRKSKMLFNRGVSSAAVILSRAYYYGYGTNKNYDKALFYLSYPHRKSSQQDKEERSILENLLELRDKSMYSAIICLAGSVVLFLFMFFTGFFRTHEYYAIFNTALLVTGCVQFVMTLFMKLIIDFSYWFLIIGLMFLFVAIL